MKPTGCEVNACELFGGNAAFLERIFKKTKAKQQQQQGKTQMLESFKY